MKQPILETTTGKPGPTSPEESSIRMTAEALEKSRRVMTAQEEDHVQEDLDQRRGQMTDLLQKILTHR